MEKADKAEGGKKSRKLRFSLKYAIQKKIEAEGAQETLNWIKREYPEKYIDMIRDVLKGEIQSNIKIRVQGEVEHTLTPRDREIYRELAKIYVQKKTEMGKDID